MSKLIRGDCLKVLDSYEDFFQLIYIDPPFNTGKRRKGSQGNYEDNKPIFEYLDWLRVRVIKMWTALKSNGSLVIHVDPTISHYIKVALDNQFGADRYINEVVWAYNSGGASKRHLSRKHDTLLWYSKSDDYVFNVLREPYASAKIEGRPGFHADGRMLTDVWNISFLSTTSSERTGYPTQKPLKLLERVIQLWTDEGDWVGDFFAGSGTTGIAARSLNRPFVLVDNNLEAIEVIRGRL